MEGGSPLFEYLTYGVIGFVLLALGILAARSAWFFLSLLIIPLAETVGRWAPFRGMVDRWGERGARRDPALWAARHDAGVRPASATAQRARVPRAVRVGAWAGAGLGAGPGVFAGGRAGLRLAGGGSALGTAWDAAAGAALVTGAGILLGAALGAAAGLLAATLRDAREP